jgi:5-formyltetrahydrofolate cyclo-ligase
MWSKPYHCIRHIFFHSRGMSPLPDRSLATEKRKLRQTMQQRRLAMPHAVMATASQAVARHFADHPILAFAPSFAGYVAMRSEVDVRPVFDIMGRFNKDTSLPCIRPEKSLMFRQWRPYDPLVRSPVGTQEPEPTAASVIPAVVLVPLLAFDGEGYRLGYGGGYYDRTMNIMRLFSTPPLFIGVGYSNQEVDQLPIDQFDEQLDGIITELGVSMFR